MIAWKIFAVFSVLVITAWLAAISFGYEQMNAMDIITVPIIVTGIYGLTTFAFSLPSLPRKFWRAFHVLYAIFAAIDVARADIEWEFDAETLLSVGVGLVIAFFNWLALYRLAGATRPPAPRGVAS